MPCADTDRDGLENPTGGPCVAASATDVLPWVDLGVVPTDGWGRLYHYRVTPEFANAVATGAPCGGGALDICDAGDITVFTRGDDPATGGTTEFRFQVNLTVDTPVAVVSFGPNGHDGMDLNGNVMAPSVAGNDEAENSDADGTFVTRTITREPSAACADGTEGSDYCEFDDLVVWIPTAQLINRLVVSGLLP